MDTKKTEVKKPEDDESKSENKLSEKQLDKVSGGGFGNYVPPNSSTKKKKKYYGP